MADSSALSNASFTIALVIVAVITLALLRYYLPIRTTPAYLLVPVFLGLALPASIILLVPVDLASSAVPEDGSARGIWLPNEVTLVIWRIAYWLTFALTWFVLPVLGEYADSGYREPRKRVTYSFKVNLRFTLIMIACFVAGLLYVFLQPGFERKSVKGLVMALAYAVGLVLAVYLMGHGLVALPRRLYRSSSVSGHLKRIQARAPRIHERLSESVEELDYLEGQVLLLRQRKTGSAKEFQEWINDLADTSDLPESRPSLTPSARVAASEIPNVITEGYLADLTRKLKRARHKRIRFVEEWSQLVREAGDTQAILDAAGSQRLDFGRTQPESPWYEKLTVMTPYTRYHLHANVLPGMRLAMSGFLGLASICIIWSEIVKGGAPMLSIVGKSIIHHPNSDDGQIGLAGQFMAICWLMYMCTATLTSVSEVKVWGNRALVRRHTYAESACWYSCQVCKLTVPLAYNFVTFLPPKIFHKTSFFNFLGSLIDLTPLGYSFNSFFPILILFPVLATAFNLYGRIKRFAGFGVLEDDDPADGEAITAFGTGGWREGRTLIERELNGAYALGLSSPSSSSPRPPAARGEAHHAASPPRLNSPSHVSAAVRASAPERDRLLDRTNTAPAQDEGDEDAGFFQDFAHRVRNTIDTADRPDWMRNMNFQKPKWMGGDDGAGGSSSGASRGGGGGNGLGRWFGGRSNSGLRI